MKIGAEFWGGSAFLALGVYVLVQSEQYPMGTAMKMGAGYFPRALGLCLVALAAVEMYRARRSNFRLPETRLRPLLAVMLAILVFGLLVRPLGLLPATFVLAIIGSLAEPRFSPVGAAVLGVGLAFLAWIIFILILGLPLRPFWV